MKARHVAGQRSRWWLASHRGQKVVHVVRDTSGMAGPLALCGAQERGVGWTNAVRRHERDTIELRHVCIPCFAGLATAAMNTALNVGTGYQARSGAVVAGEMVTAAEYYRVKPGGCRGCAAGAEHPYAHDTHCPARGLVEAPPPEMPWDATVSLLRGGEPLPPAPAPQRHPADCAACAFLAAASQAPANVEAPPPAPSRHPYPCTAAFCASCAERSAAETVERIAAADRGHRITEEDA